MFLLPFRPRRGSIGARPAPGLSYVMNKSKLADSSHAWALKNGFKEPTYTKHVQCLEEQLAERLARSVRERSEPLHMLITKAAAKSLREVTLEANAEVPQDESQAKKIKTKSPNSGIGLILSEKGALVGRELLLEVAIWIAKRTLEKWVRVLKPFASGPGLAVLISRLVHEEFSRKCARVWDDGDSPRNLEATLKIIPAPDELLGAAFRQLAPPPAVATTQPWIFVEDLEAALNLQAQFEANPDHPLRPRTAQHKTPSRTSSSMSRPHSTGSLPIMSSKGCSGALRRSGAFPWSDFQMHCGNRQTTMTNASHKQLRKFPGPDVYGDVAYHFNAGSRASWGRFPRAGGRRANCTCTPLSTMSRNFDLEHPKTD